MHLPCTASSTHAGCIWRFACPTKAYERYLSCPNKQSYIDWKAVKLLKQKVNIKSDFDRHFFNNFEQRVYTPYYFIKNVHVRFIYLVLAIIFNRYGLITPNYYISSNYDPRRYANYLMGRSVNFGWLVIKEVLLVQPRYNFTYVFHLNLNYNPRRYAKLVNKTCQWFDRHVTCIT